MTVNEQYAALITGFPLFSGFTLQGAQMLLNDGEVRSYASGELLFQEGDPATFTLLVLTGELQVFMVRSGGEVLLQEAKPGAILGELAVLCDIKRAASVRVSKDTAVLQWSAAQFRSLLTRNKSFSDRVLGQTLRTLIEKERSLVEALTKAGSVTDQHQRGREL
jgi:CRP-like cAMP-binding protein